MVYTNTWDEASPNGASTPSRNIDDEIRKVKLDLRERLADLLGIPSFSVDPLVPSYLKPSDGTNTSKLSPTSVGSVNAADFGLRSGDTDRWYIKSASGHLEPSGDNTINVGSSTKRIKDIHIGGLAYTSNVGTLTAANFGLVTNNTTRWVVQSAGSLLPNSDNTYDLGSASFRVKAAYIATNEASLFRAPTSANAYLEAQGAFSVVFKTNGSDRWNISPSGHLNPLDDNAVNIGSTTARINTINVAGNIWSAAIGTIGASDFGLKSNSILRWVIQSGGHLVAQVDKTYDIGSSTNRPRNVYVGQHLEVDGQAYNKWHNAGNTVANPFNIDWDNGNIQAITLVGNRTLTFSNPAQGAIYTLHIAQDATGNRTITWPANVRWGDNGAPNLSTTGGKVDVISFLYNGSNYIGFVSGYGF